MNVPLITELTTPHYCGFSGEMPKDRAVAMLRLYATMLEEFPAGEINVKLDAHWMDVPEFKVLRYSHF